MGTREIERNQRAVPALKVDEMNDEGKDGTAGMEPGDDEALWRLLGKARRPEVSPYFSRRVLREAAQAEAGRGRLAGSVGGWLAGLRRMCQRPRVAVWPGAVALGVFWLSVVLTIHDPAPGHIKHRPRSDAPAPGEPAVEAATTTVADAGDAVLPMAAEDVAPQDVEVIADLDNIITREENRLWTEDTARF